MEGDPNLQPEFPLEEEDPSGETLEEFAGLNQGEEEIARQKWLTTSQGNAREFEEMMRTRYLRLRYIKKDLHLRGQYSEWRPRDNAAYGLGDEDPSSQTDTNKDFPEFLSEEQIAVLRNLPRDMQDRLISLAWDMTYREGTHLLEAPDGIQSGEEILMASEINEGQKEEDSLQKMMAKLRVIIDKYISE